MRSFRFNQRNCKYLTKNCKFSLKKIQAQTEELEEAYQELSESEEKYRKLFENMQEGFFIADIITDKSGKPLDYQIIEANQAFKAQKRVLRGGLIGKTAYETYPDLDPFWAETYGSVALTGKPAHFENYADPYGRYYEVLAYQIWPGRFAAIFLDITERKQAEQKVLESQIRFLIAKEAANLGIYDYDIASGIIQWDERVREIWGIEPEEPINYNTFMAGLHAEDRALTQEAVDKALDPGGSGKYYAEYRVVSRKDEKERWVAATGHTIFEDNRALRLTGTVQDITKQKKTEEALRENQARLETIFTAIPDTIIEYDINGQPVRANEAALKAYGLCPPNLTRNKAIIKLKITHMDGSPVKVEELPTSRALKGEIIEGEFYRFTDAEGKELVISTYAAPLFKDNKISGAVALWHDITELKRAEGEMQESEKLYRAIAKNFPNGMVYVFDRNLRFLVADGEALENIGWSKEKIEGKFVYELDEETRRLIEPRYRNVLAGQSLSFETVYRERIFLSQYVPIRDDKGEIFAGLVVGLDITELKEIEAALKRNEKRLNDLLNSIQDGFLELDEGWRFTYINKRAASNGNFEPEELIGQNIWEKFPYMVATEFEKIYRKVMNTRLPEHFEIKSLVLNKWYEVSVYPSTAGISIFWRDVTERKKVEEALQKSESDLKKSQEIAHVGSWEWDLETNLVTGSKEMYRIFDLSPDPATFFQQYIDLLVPEDRQRVLDALNETVKGNAPYNVDYQVVLQNGIKRFIHAEAVTIYDNGKPVKVIGTAHDITERKAVEMELLHQRELLQQIFDNIPVLLVIWDPHLERFTLNRYAEQVLGWTTAEANSGDFMAKVYPDPAYPSKVSDYMLSLESGWRELIGATKNGERIPIGWANIFLTDNTIVGIGVDLRERKKAEAKLKETLDNLENLVKIRTVELEKAYNSLKESEEGLSEAQKMAHLGNWNLDLTTYELYWSDEVYRIFGLDPQQSSMDFTKYLEYVHPEDRKGISDAFTRVLYENPCEMDYRIMSASGKERILHSQCEVIFDKENIPVQIKGTVQDVTERKKAEDALAKIDKARIKEIHLRIKNNLQVISSLLDLQAETFSHLEVCKAPEVIKAFKESQSRIASMALIHEELYEGKESGNLDFAAYLRKLTAYLLNLYNLKTAGVNLKLDFEEIYLNMDTAIPLGIIVNELVSNSLKHAFPQGKQKEIKIILQKKENFIIDKADSEPGNEFGDNCKEDTFKYALTVADNGKGIPEEIDLQNAETLGLQLVNILVEQIDGCIELKRSRGTEFTIWFNNIEI